MVNMPGREGAVTGGTFDQSKRLLLSSLLFPGPDASGVVGPAVVLPEGAGAAAKACSVRLSTPARPNFTSHSNMRCGEVEKQLGLLADAKAGRQSGRRITGFQGLRIKMPATITNSASILN